MSDRVPICTIPGLVSQLVAVDVLVAPADVVKLLTRVFLQRTDNGAGDIVSADLRNATGGGGEGISVTLGDGDSEAVAAGAITVEASEGLYLRVTAADASSQNLRGWFEFQDDSIDVTSALTNLARVKQFALITDSASDALLNSIIAGVSSRMQSYLGRAIVQETITAEKHDGRDRDTLQLDAFPVIVPPAVVVRSVGTVVEATTYEVDAARGHVVKVTDGAAGAWPAGRRNLEVDYTAGYAAVPEDLVLAATQQVVFLYQRRGARVAERGSTLELGGGSQYLTGPWAAGVLQTLESYRLLEVA